MTTLATAIGRFGVDVHEHLDRDELVPVSAGMQRQGDVLVIPRTGFVAGSTVPAAGVAVVRGENGGNTHLLLADGPVRFEPVEAQVGSLTIGTLEVERGATAYLAHPEHGYLGIAPGTYEVRRQREQADEIRIVAD